MLTRRILDTDVSAIGLGGMPMSIEGRPGHKESLRTIHAALDAGVTLIDTANSYHQHAGEVGHNERLIAEALRTWGGDASSVMVATKGGHLRPGDGSWTQDGRPEHLKKAAKESCKALGVESIGLYYYHRPDPKVPYEDSIGALVELLAEGVIQRAGISNASVDQINMANKLLEGRLAAVQNEYSPAHRDSQPELEECAKLGIAFLPWSPLGGIMRAKQLGEHFYPFAQVAAHLRVSTPQVALAWELAQAPVVIPIPGATKPESILDSVKAVDITLTQEEMATLNAVG